MAEPAQGVFLTTEELSWVIWMVAYASISCSEPKWTAQYEAFKKIWTNPDRIVLDPGREMENS